MSKKGRRIDLGGESGLTHNPFAALRGAADGREEAAVGPAPVSAPGHASDGATQSVDDAELQGSHVVVRRERKGHGGKTVTVVSWSRPAAPDGEALERLAREVARALGAGARAEGATIVVQGDAVARVADRLEATLGARVTRGN